MRPVVLALGLAAACASAPGAGPSLASAGGPIAIVHVTVIDGTGRASEPDLTVVVSGNRIAAVTPAAEATVPAGATVVEGRGRFLIPGLWDMHVHTSWDRGFTIPLLIANGVTGVREMFGKDPGAVLELRREIAEGRVLGPRIVTAGPIVDGPDPAWPGSIVVRSAAEGRAAVDRIAEEGVDFVKVYSGLTRDAYFAIADEARRRGIPFAGHVPDAVTDWEASAAGQRSIEHLNGALPAASDPRRADSLFATFRANATWQTPTLTVLQVGADPGDPSLLTRPELGYVPYPLRWLWGLVRHMAAGDPASGPAAIRRATFERQLAVVGQMYRSGVPLLAGSDEPNPYTVPGASLHRELELLVRAGLPPMAALQAATLGPARFLGAEDSLGTIAPGKLADLVLLEADPLADIANTRTIAAVVRDGRLLDRAALNRLLDRVRRNRWRPPAAALILGGAIAARVPAPAWIGLVAAVLGIAALGLIFGRRVRRRRRASTTGRAGT